MSKENKRLHGDNEQLNPFKLINNVDELPPKLKEEVMSTINHVHLVTDVGKLFSIDMARTVGKMVDPTPDKDD